MTQDKPTIEEALKDKIWIDNKGNPHIAVLDAMVAMKEYAASLNRQGWTRVEDGLPEYAGEYLCRWENPNKPHKYDVLMFSVDGIWRMYDSVADDYEEAFASVSHWMPLPNKPSI